MPRWVVLPFPDSLPTFEYSPSRVKSPLPILELSTVSPMNSSQTYVRVKENPDCPADSSTVYPVLAEAVVKSLKVRCGAFMGLPIFIPIIRAVYELLGMAVLQVALDWSPIQLCRPPPGCSTAATSRPCGNGCVAVLRLIANTWHSWYARFGVAAGLIGDSVRVITRNGASCSLDVTKTIVRRVCLELPRAYVYTMVQRGLWHIAGGCETSAMQKLDGSSKRTGLAAALAMQLEECFDEVQASLHEHFASIHSGGPASTPAPAWLAASNGQVSVVCNEPSDATKNARKRPLEEMRVDNGADHSSEDVSVKHRWSGNDKTTHLFSLKGRVETAHMLSEIEQAGLQAAVTKFIHSTSKTREAMCNHSGLVRNAFSMLERFLLHSTPTDQDVARDDVAVLCSLSNQSK